VFYYRIQSPVILIEFDPLGRSNDYYQGDTGPQRACATIVRIPHGNDSRRDLLAEHYAASLHHARTPAAGTPIAEDGVREPPHGPWHRDSGDPEGSASNSTAPFGQHNRPDPWSGLLLS